MRRRPSIRLMLGLAAGTVALLPGGCSPVEEPNDGKVHLRFVCWDGNESMRCIRKAAAQFEAAYPNIKVKVESVTQSYQEKLLAQVAAHCPPDVAMMDPGNFQRFAKRDAILPLNQFFDDVAGFDIKGYYKEIVEPHSYHGQLFVLPRDIAPVGIIYYNKKAFDEAGIPYPDGKWTWDFKVRPELKEKDFLWVMQRLTTKDQRGRTVCYGFGSIGNLSATFRLSQQARLADDYEQPSKVLYTDPRVISSYELAARLCREGWVPSPTEITTSMQSSERQLFTQQKAAMYQTGIWDVPEIRTELIPGRKDFFEWDITMAPAFRDGTHGFPTGGSGYCILSQTKHPREAWLLTQWMAGPPGMIAMAEAGRAQPAIRKLALQEPWIPGPNTPKEQQYPASRIWTDRAVPFVRFGPTAEYWGDVADFADQKLNSIFDGSSDAKTALTIGSRNAQARLDQILRERESPPFNWTVGAIIGLAIATAIGVWVYWPERKVKRTDRQKRETRVAYLFIAPWLFGLIALGLGPMILSLLMSASNWDIIRPATWKGLGNYTDAFSQDPRFWTALKVTMIYTACAVPLGLVVSLALALLLNVKVRGMPLFRTCYYIPSLASGVAAALIWKKVFQADGGLLNTLIYGADGHGNFLGLATALQPLATSNGEINWLGNEHTALFSLILKSVWGAGGAMIILLAGLQGVPQHYYEAATVDGAGPWRRFRSVTIPLMSPALLFCLITGFIGTFQVFTDSYVMTSGGPNDATMFYMLHLYRTAFLGLRMGYASAMAWLLFLIILVFTLIQLRMGKWVYYEAETR
jgi:ABC-type sugar transport system permease subunit/ABC-type glycerol-3-phosphate transport system substrate-binding protein